MDGQTVTRASKRKQQSTAPAGGAFHSSFYRCGERHFAGYVIDSGDPSRKLTVEILVNGLPFRVIRADAPAAELVAEAIGDGCYGFSCFLPETAFGGSAVVEARLANIGTAVGTPIELAGSAEQLSQRSGSLRWLGGVRFSGSIAGREELTTANVHVDGILITRIRASTWSHVGTSEEDAHAVCAFDFQLPDRFADGRAHQVTLSDASGEIISTRPLFFIAYADGLREAVAGQGISAEERLRAELFDQLLPMSVPFSRYEEWRERFLMLPGPSVSLRGAVILVGDGAAEDTFESLNEQTHTEWVAASLPEAEHPLGLRPEPVQAFLAGDGADCDFVVFTLAGTLFAPFALQRIATAFAEFTDASAVYADVDLQSDDGSVWPLAFPAFDYERMLEQGYCAYLFALRRSAAEQALDHGAANLYRMFNSVLDDSFASAADIVHLPGPLATLPQFDKNAANEALAAASRAHLERKSIDVQIAPHPSGLLPIVRVGRMFHGSRTTIIIPTRNRKNLLRTCLDSIQPAVERTQAQVLVVDNDSADPDTLDYLAEIKRRGAMVLRVPGAFNFPRLNNYAAKAADGDVLCLLNNDIKALDGEWLEEMFSRLAGDNTGAVGAQLVWPSGVVQHGGIVLGPSFSATHAFNDRINGDVGYGDLLHVAHECSAVTAACMVTRRIDYLMVGGMDEKRFPVNFNDVDYCLKLRSLGKRIVFTPHARLEHLESASRGLDASDHRKARFERELHNLRAKWGNTLANDPYYNPILSLDPIPFSALAWPIRSMEPRRNDPPLPTEIPAGF
jgi:GT2 family glycosyltransferase